MQAQSLSLHGKEIVNYSLEILSHYGAPVVVRENPLVEGSLNDQVLNVLKTLSLSSATPDFVLLHDATRPLLTHAAVTTLLDLLLEGHEVVTSVVPIRDPIWTGDSLLTEASALQTPEGFPFTLLLKAYEWRSQVKRTFSSSTELVVSWKGIQPSFVPLTFFNNSIETEEDIAVAEGILKFGQEKTGADPLDLSGLHVLVLGGSGGIGTACVELLERLGATAHAPGRRELDLNKEQDYSDLDRYQAVIHAAGAYKESADEIMQVNFFSCLNLLRCAESKRWRGNIVFISSTASSWGRPGITVYSASKAALNSLVESEAHQLGAKEIFVNAVAPAKVNTRLQSMINPAARAETMLSPRYVARFIIRYLRTTQYGRILFLRKGFDVD